MKKVFGKLVILFLVTFLLVATAQHQENAMAHITYKTVKGKIYLSRDSGQTWDSIHSWFSNVTYISWSRQQPEKILAVKDGNIHRSTNSGKSWTIIKFFDEGLHPAKLFHAHDVGSFAYYIGYRLFTGGRIGSEMWLSHNSGVSWEQVWRGNEAIFDVQRDEMNVNLLYFTTSEGTTWCSTNRGFYWQQANDSNERIQK